MNRTCLLAAIVTVFLLLACTGCGERAEITGTAAFRERLALPPDAVLEVTLEDVSRADAPATVLGRTVLSDCGHPPYDFAVAYDPGAIDPAHAYSLRARITVGDRLMFTTDQAYPVLTRDYGTTADLLLVRVPGEAASPSRPAPMRGMLRYLADAAVFTDCLTRARLPVAMEADFPAAERAYLAARREPGAEVLVTFTGRVADRPAMEGDGQVPTVIIDHFEGCWPGETCGNPGATAALEDSYWKLTRLEGRPVRVFQDQREPHLVIRTRDGQVGGSAGCNRFSGGYDLDGDALSFGMLAGTMMACPEGMEQEQAFLAALGRVTGWRIEGQHLELLDGEGVVLLRLEESPKQ